MKKKLKTIVNHNYGFEYYYPCHIHPCFSSHGSLGVTKPNLGLFARTQWSQSTDTGLWGRKVQHLLQGTKQGVQGSQCLKDPNSSKAFRERFLKTGWGRGVVGYVISSWTFFWLVGGEVIRNQHHQASGSSQSGVYVLMGNLIWRKLTSSTWWGFQCLQNSSKDMTQNITYSPWGGTKCPWLCLKAKLLLICLAWLCSFLHFLTSLIKLIRWLNFSTDKRQWRTCSGQVP